MADLKFDELNGKLIEILTDQADNSPADAAMTLCRWISSNLARPVTIGESLSVSMLIADGRGRRHPLTATAGKIISRLMLRRAG